MQKSQLGLLASIPLIAVFALLFFNADAEYNEVKEVYDNSQTQGHFTLVKTNSDGEITQYIQTPNLIVDGGMDTMGDLMFDDIDLNSNATDSVYEWLEIGTGGSGPTATDTDIQASACARGNDTAVTGVSGVSGEITVTVDFAFDGGTCAGGIVEAAMFNDINDGEMLARSVFGIITIGAGDTLTVTYDITIT